MAVHVNVTVEPDDVAFKLVTSFNLSKRSETFVGSVPFVKYSVLLKSAGVYSLANVDTGHPYSISTATTPLGCSND